MRGVCTHGEGGSFWRLRPPVLRSLIQSRRHDVHINHTHWHEVRHTAQPGINSSPTHPKKKEDGHAQTTEDHKLYSAKALLNSITPSAPRSDSSLHLHQVYIYCLSNDFYIEITSSTNSFWIDLMSTACLLIGAQQYG